MALLFLSVALVLVSTINAAAPEFYQSIKGDCNKLPELFKGTIREVPAGLYYIAHATFGVKCGTVYALIRPGLGYGDVSVLPTTESKETNEYVQFTNDVTYEEDKLSYKATSGGRSYVLDSDGDNYCYFVQCQEVDGQTSIGIIFGSRTETVSDEVKLKYDAVTEKLKENNLFPEGKVFDLSNEDCPPLPPTFKPIN